MMKKFKYYSAIILSAAIYFIFKAVSLFNFIRDGDGIGITLLGLELNDTVPYEQVPQYSWAFLIIGVILIGISIIIQYKSKAYRV
jgi:hypothetical protein